MATNEELIGRSDVNDIEAILSFMPRSGLSTLSELLGQLRDGLHVRAERKRMGPARRIKRRPMSRD